jgi:UDP-N-acetylglucosamine diphosphorylase / glucose-1-phosphate thymidylyltransferase / UDP-N-acetylgalactosamine diphosphorylase / glucosamine-1-phosphate N-acetyltransferase / galactosamine-1-phosphate N-acetyltransferase
LAQPPLHPVSAYLDLTKTQAASMFYGVGEVWEVIPKIAPWLAANLTPGVAAELRPGTESHIYIGPQVRIGRGTTIHPGAVILGPAWIGENCVIAPGCYVRENVIMGDGVIAGNSSEFKNCVVFDRAEVPHWNYVGDSILGYYAHLGAGVILSNWRHDHGSIPVLDPVAGRIETGLPKFGAIIGDEADLGAHAVLNPGSLIGRRSVLYPGTVWRGTLPAERIVKLRQTQEVVERR